MTFLDIATYRLCKRLPTVFRSKTQSFNNYWLNCLGRLDIKAAQFTLFDNKPHKFAQLTKIVKHPITLQSKSADLGGSSVMQFDLTANHR